jgi:hypothetical protein
MRSSETSTRLMPLKLKSSSTRYIGGSTATRWTIVPSASCTFRLKATPLIVRPLRFTFTRWFGSNTPELPEDHLVTGLYRDGYGTSEPEPTIQHQRDRFFQVRRNSQGMVGIAGGLCNRGMEA